MKQMRGTLLVALAAVSADEWSCESYLKECITETCFLSSCRVLRVQPDLLKEESKDFFRECVDECEAKRDKHCAEERLLVDDAAAERRRLAVDPGAQGQCLVTKVLDNTESYADLARRLNRGACGDYLNREEWQTDCPLGYSGMVNNLCEMGQVASVETCYEMCNLHDHQEEWTEPCPPGIQGSGFRKRCDDGDVTLLAEDCGAALTVTSGLKSWFKFEDWDENTKQWTDNVRGVAIPVAGPVVTVKESGNRASAVVGYLSGDQSVTMNFGQVVASDFTICSVTRYTGANRKRIINGGPGNWLHGNWGGQIGVAHYDSWDTSSNNAHVSPLQWLVFCGTNNGIFYGNDGKINAGRGQGSGDKTIGIHTDALGGCCHGEWSNFGIMELITWDRHLSEQEVVAARDYLLERLASGNHAV